MGEQSIMAIAGIITMAIGCGALIAVVWMLRAFFCFSISLGVTELMVRWAKKNDFESIERISRHWAEGPEILGELKAIKEKMDKTVEAS